MANEVVEYPNAGLIEAEGMPQILAKVRPEWREKNLIERVKKLIHVDPSSACQRILNAAIHDLKEKIVIAGLDIASEAAQQNKLPPVNKADDIENYSTHNVINLSYRMGILSRPEWRRLSRSYEIRRDLEHEDDSYEAGIEDIVYIFKTAIDVVLSRDPVDMVRVTDFKDIVEQPQAATIDEALLEDFRQAPSTRQIEIVKALISISMDREQPDLVQQNAFAAVQTVSTKMQKEARLAVGKDFQSRVGRELNERQARVAHAAGIMSYVRQAARKSFFASVLEMMNRVGSEWSAYSSHGDLLRGFMEYGGLDHCPEEHLKPITRWLLLTYLGTPGGVTSFGNVRHVYYSNSAAPLIKEIFENTSADLEDIIVELEDDKTVKARIADKHIRRRFDAVMDMVAE